MPAPDLISDGAPDPGPHRRRPLGRLLVGLLLALVLGAAYGDQRLRSSTADRLLEETTRGAATAGYVERRVLAVADYAAPALFGAATPPPVRASLLAVVQREAADLAPSVTEASARVAGVSVLPWHRGLRQARQDATDYLAARAASLAEAGDEIEVLFTASPVVQGARERAEESLLKVLAGTDARERVEAALDGDRP